MLSLKTCVAVLCLIGISVQQAYRSLPGPPNLRLLAASWTSVYFRIEPGQESRHPTKGFYLQYRAAGSLNLHWWTNIQILPPDVANQNTSVTNLNCGNSYTFVVREFNAVGHGEESNQVTIQTKKPEIVMNDFYFSFIEPGKNYLDIFFKRLLTTNECPVYGQAVKYKHNDMFKWRAVDHVTQYSNWIRIPNLTESTWYDLRVTVITSAGFLMPNFTISTLTTEGELPPPSKQIFITPTPSGVKIRTSEWNRISCPTLRRNIVALYKDESDFSSPTNKYNLQSNETDISFENSSPEALDFLVLETCGCDKIVCRREWFEASRILVGSMNTSSTQPALFVNGNVTNVRTLPVREMGVCPVTHLDVQVDFFNSNEKQLFFQNVTTDLEINGLSTLTNYSIIVHAHTCNEYSKLLEFNATANPT